MESYGINSEPALKILSYNRGNDVISAEDGVPKRYAGVAGTMLGVGWRSCVKVSKRSHRSVVAVPEGIVENDEQFLRQDHVLSIS